jgi:hypothetical protein
MVLRARLPVRGSQSTDKLVQALKGIASCATKCGCCAMHKSIAEAALKEFFYVTQHGKTYCADCASGRCRWHQLS